MEYQRYFVELLRKMVPANINLAEEISSLLKISADSAYRRLRCETDISYNETLVLCKHFDIPLDALTDESPEAITFKIHRLDGSLEHFGTYMDSLNADIINMGRFDSKEIIYAAEDLPVFYSFFLPLLARFKIAYWNKSILNMAELQGLVVEDVHIPADWMEKLDSIASHFQKVNSTEIWNEDTLKSTIRQIRFYWEAGFFKHKESALGVIEELRTLIDIIQRQCETGKKFNHRKGQFTEADYTLYTCDLMIGSNCVFMRAEEKEASYIGYNSFNYMRTSNAYFNEQEKSWINNLITKSTLISKVAEKQRNLFFKELFRQIEELHVFVKEV